MDKFKLFKNIEKLVKANFFMLVGGFVIFPFILIAIFNNPSGDDFGFNTTTSLYGYWEAQKFWYNNISGRYLTFAILSFRFFVSGSFFIYKLMPIIWIILFFSAIYYLSRQLFDNLNKKGCVVVTSFVFTIYLFQMPNVAEGFYWLSAAVSYQASLILLVFLMSFIIKLLKTNETRYLIISIILLVGAIGTNEISMLMIDFLLGMILIYSWVKEKKVNNKILILVLVALIFTAIVGLAPGNAKRYLLSHSPYKHNFYFALKNSLSDLLHFTFIWSQVFIIWAMIFFNYFEKQYQRITSNFFNVNPIIIITIVLITVFIGFFTGSWSQGYTSPSRTINLMYFFFILGFLYFVFFLYFKYNHLKKSFISFSPWVKYFLIFFLFIKLMHNNNVKTAYSELITGEAYYYDLELRKRYQMIKNCASDTCYVPKLTNKPATLFSRDISDSLTDWNNTVYSQYWLSKQIILKKVE